MRHPLTDRHGLDQDYAVFEGKVGCYSDVWKKFGTLPRQTLGRAASGVETTVALHTVADIMMLGHSPEKCPL
jgi:hypothetical protein